MVRNLWMALLIPLAGILYHRGGEASKRTRQRWHQIVPLFVVGFLAMACLRSIGDEGVPASKAFGLIARNDWDKVVQTLNSSCRGCLQLRWLPSDWGQDWQN